MERFLLSSLQKILGITWRDKVPHRTILERTNCPSMDCIVKRNQLRWIGLVVRMVDSRNNFFSESFVRVCDVQEDNLSVTKMPLGYLEGLPYTSI